MPTLAQLFPVNQLVNEAIIGTVLAVVGGIVMFPVRIAYRKGKAAVASVKSEWFRATAQLDELQKELVTQRTNCLATLQSQGKEQVDVSREGFKEIAGVLREIHNGQLEMSGYLKGSNRN